MKPRPLLDVTAHVEHPRLRWRTFLGFALAAPAAVGSYTASAGAAVPNGIVTPHSALVTQWAGQLPHSVKPASEGMVLRCFETIQHSEVIGVSHGMVVHASSTRLVSVMEDYAHYKDLFDDIIEVRTKSVPNGLLEFWEQKAPVVFLPNTRFTINTIVHDEMPERKIWHSRLVSSNQLLGDDVFVAVYPLDAIRAYYWEVDFVNAKWGLASAIAMSTIWSGAVSSTVAADLDLKVRAENPTWTYDQVRDAARKRVDDRLVDHCVKHRASLDLSKPPPLREP